MTFAIRYGFEPEKTIQFESMDDDLRNSLWNLHEDLFAEICPIQGSESNKATLNTLLTYYWTDFFKQPIHLINKVLYQQEKLRLIRDKFFKLQWYGVYSFIEITVSILRFMSADKKLEFTQQCNTILENENSAYRFMNGIVAPVTSNIEIEEIEASLTGETEAAKHMASALAMFGNRSKNQYRECCDEAISAVEAIARKITGEKKSTLGKLCTKLNLHPSYSEALKKIYGYTSDADGIRHSLTKDSKEIQCEDARFLLVMCSAFVNFIKMKNP